LIDEFVALAHEHHFQRAWIEAFFAAMRMDTEKYFYNTYAELEAYMYGSAEVVGLMMTTLIGYTGESDEVFLYARRLGEAMQYTNFLRDIGEDRNDHHRVYMPLDRLQAH